MLNLTPCLRPVFARYTRAQQRTVSCEGLRNAQTAVLRRLLHAARNTEYGSRYRFESIDSPRAFADAVPMGQYPQFRADIERMVRGERNVLWPGVCRRFAQSSGTSDGKSKYIPVTDDSLRFNHYMGGRMSAANYLNLYPQSRLFGGDSFILGGSFANEIADLPKGVRVGDLSAHLIDRIPVAVELVRVPSRRVALMSDWTEKLPALVESSIGRDIVSISGVPSWFLTVLRHVLARTGASNIHEVWPNLEVFFHGGIAFGPYRAQYEAITDPVKMRYLETYNASEGFFAVRDSLHHESMRLLADAGIFFEFLPLGGTDPVPAWMVEAGRTYELVITSCNGLWRYQTGDTVRVDTVEPLRIFVAGRTKSFINAFGEELMVHNADTALATACAATGASVLNYTAAPVYADSGHRGRHQWLIEWNTPPADIQQFAAILDSELQKCNSDYQAKRSGNIFLDCLTITTANPGLFDLWLASTGKLGGQRKVPRLSNSRNIIDSVLKLQNNKIDQ